MMRQDVMCNAGSLVPGGPILARKGRVVGSPA